MKPTVQQPLDFLREMMMAYSENRTDVADQIEAYLETGRPFDPTMVEKRFIIATIPNSPYRVEYDTLTTEIAYHNMQEHSQWAQCVEHEYSDE